ncbi:hypothetical protein [uncultured Sulfitobacter sp.]|tara:strand:+ start:130362 stop:130538 length:177 start_codon:yes stop_codon:yes gene_type:complete
MFERKQAVFMGKLIKFLIFIILFGFLSLAVYAYLGPFFGADFAPDQVEVREAVQLPAQ